MSLLPIDTVSLNNRKKVSNKISHRPHPLIANAQINRTGGAMDQSNKPVSENINLNSTIEALQQVIAEQAAQLIKAQEQLQKEVVEHQHIEANLRRAKNQLEVKNKQRITALLKTNTQLRKQLRDREAVISQRAEAASAINRRFREREQQFIQQIEELEADNQVLQNEIRGHNLMEEKLLSSDAQNRAIFEAMTDIILVIDAEGNHIKIAPTNPDVLYQSSIDIIGETVNQFLQGEQSETFINQIQQVIETQQSISFEYKVPIENPEFCFSASISPMPENSALWVARDITQRKQAQEALQQQLNKEQLIGAISQRIHQSLNLREVLNITVVEIRQFLNCDRVIIFRLNSDGSGAVVVESVGDEWLSISGININDRHFAENYAQLYQQGRIQAIEDIYTAGLTQCHIDCLAEFQVRANLVVPIVNEDNLWGLLVAQHCSEPRQWQPSEIDLLKSISTQSAIAIQQAELYNQSRTATAIAQEQTLKLEQTLRELKHTQSKLVHSEKMSALGQLVAGVAHEINNPLNFISGNITYINQYTEDLLNLIQLYQDYYPNPAVEIQVLTQQIELDFLKEDLPSIIYSMNMGANRISQIVLSLRNFSRLDEAEKKWVDLHQGLDNTLLILDHRLKTKRLDVPDIKVIKNYGYLPKVYCYAGELNQVFMNILANAIDAIEESKHERSLEEIENNPNTIWIRTEALAESNQVVILIRDNAAGMTQEVQDKLFDPFFTTKPVGQGTGLGMSISYKIVVDQHGGQLECISSPGQGTTFLIYLPVQ